jgi:serine/threonine protein kinase
VVSKEEKTMNEIRLEKQSWLFDESDLIGPEGGFGAVFSGLSPDGQKVAVKRLKVDAEISAHRELRIASQLAGKSMKHIVPIFDSGEDADTGRYFVVMALAEKSLQSDLDAKKIFTQDESIDILHQTCEGLVELNGLVHRDLKPGNLLFHEGAWKIADFGIARFIEESTSLQTLKGCLSPQYAAPEQWDFDRAEVATDLYALGCIGYRLLTGHLPFPGPTMEQFREQHAKAHSPELPDALQPRLRTLIGMLLRKSPQARPSLERVRDLLSGMDLAPQQRNNGIAEAAARLEQARAKEDAASAAQRSSEDSREGLARSGRSVLGQIMTNLRDRILHEAPSVTQDSSAYVTFGKAQFSLPIARNFDYLKTIPPNSFPRSQIDVVLAKTIEIQQLTPRYVWGSSLLYCRFPKKQDYRWYEVSFMISPLSRATGPAPISLLEETNNATSRYHHADLALSTTMHSYQAAFGPIPIDDENEEIFIDRWMTVFGAGAEGRLKYPSRLPLTDSFWENLSIYGI